MATLLMAITLLVGHKLTIGFKLTIGDKADTLKPRKSKEKVQFHGAPTINPLVWKPALRLLSSEHTVLSNFCKNRLLRSLCSISDQTLSCTMECNFCTFSLR